MANETTYLESTDDAAQALARAAFPTYIGRKFKVRVQEQVGGLTTYWSGGSRDSVVAVQLSTMRAMPVPGVNPMVDHTAPEYKLAPDLALVVHSIYCGKDAGITFYLHPSNAAVLLTEGPTVTEREGQILAYFRSYTSAYRRVALQSAHVTDHELDSLVARKLLTRNRAGSIAITVAGKNACKNVKIF